MFDDLLPYFNRELAALRRLAGQFAEAHPKIAGRLRLGRDSVDDPHVERLIQAVAFLNARVRHKLDEDFPELTDALLGVLYPHYLRPMPSMAIVQFSPRPQAKAAVVIPAGTPLNSEPVERESCQFQTCYPTTVWPIEIESATITGRPLLAPPNPRAAGASASLRLRLRCQAPGGTFAALKPDTLRFFLRGTAQQVHPLYELILNNTVAVSVARDRDDPDPLYLAGDSVHPVGFGRDEGMLPYLAQSHLGYRLLTEYFSFPEKFLFFDLSQLAAKAAEAGPALDLYLYFDRVPEFGLDAIQADNFALGCTPVVNLFSKLAEPIALTHRDSEYEVVPDARRPSTVKPYCIEEVTLSGADGKSSTYAPFYSPVHGSEGREDGFWLSRYRSGGALSLSLVDRNFDPRVPADWVALVRCACTNGDLAQRLPFSAGRPQFTPAEPMPQIAGIVAITPPTRQIQPPLAQNRWRLVSHLSLNHLSLSDGEEQAGAVHELLTLYDLTDSAENRSVIAGIRSVVAQPGVARQPGGGGRLCRGIDVRITFDARHFSGSGLYLLASVLQHFFSLYASINSFVRVTAQVEGRPGVLRQWPPKSGDKMIL